jgi:hypothetical protein
MRGSMLRVRYRRAHKHDCFCNWCGQLYGNKTSSLHYHHNSSREGSFTYFPDRHWAGHRVQEYTDARNVYARAHTPDNLIKRVVVFAACYHIRRPVGLSVCISSRSTSESVRTHTRASALAHISMFTIQCATNSARAHNRTGSAC